eukprot:1354611-Rhodomonas_salina.1
MRPQVAGHLGAQRALNPLHSAASHSLPCSESSTDRAVRCSPRHWHWRLRSCVQHLFPLGGSHTHLPDNEDRLGLGFDVSDVANEPRPDFRERDGGLVGADLLQCKDWRLFVGVLGGSVQRLVPCYPAQHHRLCVAALGQPRAVAQYCCAVEFECGPRDLTC